MPNRTGTSHHTKPSHGKKRPPRSTGEPEPQLASDREDTSDDESDEHDRERGFPASQDRGDHDRDTEGRLDEESDEDQDDDDGRSRS